MSIIQQIKDTITWIEEDQLLTPDQINDAKKILSSDNWVLLTQSADGVKVSMNNDKHEVIVEILNDEGTIISCKNGKEVDWDAYGYAALHLCRENASWMTQKLPGKKYTRNGMIRRVMEERQAKANAAQYHIEWADNIYGEHILTNEKGASFRITLRDLDKETGYIDNIDWRTNKLYTTKHIMYVYNQLRQNPHLFQELNQEYPFIDITLDPTNDYQISWYYPHTMDAETHKIIKQAFGTKQHIPDDQIPGFLTFVQQCYTSENIKIRPEVLEKIDHFFNKRMASQVFRESNLDYSVLKVELFPYQKEGVEFAVQRTGAIIADEMGLGKTIQALAIAVFKKQIYNFSKTLVICPASIKHQWKSEIEKFTNETSLVVEGFPDQRALLYNDNHADIFIINYETVLRDLTTINSAGFDFVILDEAQKIKNYSTKTALAIKKIKKQHGLVITGTPIENKLVDLYSIVQFVEPYLLTPLWEFSYQHCLFDPSTKNRIVGYYNLNGLKERMGEILLRREKSKVIKQLPQVSQENIYVQLHEEQARIHASASKGIAKILNKKFKTPYDWQKLMLLLTTMRMACNSTFLVDKETNHSSKLVELKQVLIDQLDLKNNLRKVIIFSEWITMLHLIGEVLKELGLGFVMLTGKVPVKKRKDLIREFDHNPECRIFLSTESGGSGLNLQMADIVINYELPWNPAKKNQRIGRIDRLGQKSSKLTVLNLVSVGTIEQRIAAGLMLKQNLFDGVLTTGNEIDNVDFSTKGRAQFITELEQMLDDFKNIPVDQELKSFTEEKVETSDENEDLDHVSDTEDEPSEAMKQEEQYEHLEEVLSKGMEFLSGIYKMASGQELNAKEDKTISVDRTTGEVTMKFKIKF